MRIFQVITRCGLGGAQSVVVSLANILCKEHEVIVIAGEGDGKMLQLLDERVRVERCHSMKRPLSPINDLKTVAVLRRLYRKYRPDIVHLHSSKAGMLGRTAFPKSRVVYTVHGFDSIRVAFRKLLPVERSMQKRCAFIVGVSRYDEVNMRTERIATNVTHIYNGIIPMKQDNSLNWDIPARFKKTILCIARLSPQKNSSLFMEVASLLPDYAFVWIGNQHEVADKPSNVFFLGNIPDAGRYNQLADLFMLPSNYEGLPMVILEAMCFGRPVVASDVGGIHEIVKNDVNGYVLENKAVLFAEKIRYILDSSDVYERFSLNTLEIFYKELTAEKMVGSYIELYKKVLLPYQRAK